MSTKNPSINVTFEEKTAGFLSFLASQEHKSVSGLVKELVLDALEMREDFYLSKTAKELDKEGVKIFEPHDAWK